MSGPGGLRSSFSVFANRNYRLFWFGGLVSNIGRWFQTIAIPIVVFDLTDSAAWVGLAGFAQIMPMALMGVDEERRVDAKQIEVGGVRVERDALRRDAPVRDRRHDRLAGARVYNLVDDHRGVGAEQNVQPVRH